MKTRRRHTLNLLRSAVALLFASAFLSRCANMMTPTGGPRDSLPPVIVAMTPDNFTTNRPTVGHDKIYIEFDEFVQIKDQQKEFFTSPEMKKKPTITVRGRGIVIQLRDTLRPNTTYALNFGSAICDNNEGNPLYSMRYVFSTGPEIDSMVFSGYTADGYKSDSVSKSFIWFYPADSVEYSPRLRFDGLQVPPGCHRTCREQRHLHCPEPQADPLPDLCRAGQERQPALRAGNRPDRLHRGDL